MSTSPDHPPTCSVIIATLDRRDSLRVVLECLGRQTRPPLEVIIAAAGDILPVEELARSQPARFPVRVLACTEKSAACQRNTAAAQARGEVLAFLDDDIEFTPDLFARLLAHFSAPGPMPGAIAARIADEDRTTPGRCVRAYYRVQAGYAHADFGGRLFGAGINCYPVFRADSPVLFPSEWLPATCLFVRADLFHAERFPTFDGYSFAEDVHLSARIGRSAPLYFATRCLIQHHSLPSEFKRDPAALTAGKLHNMAVIAHEVQGLHGLSLCWRWQLHRLFMVAILLLRRPDGWRRELRGVITARI